MRDRDLRRYEEVAPNLMGYRTNCPNWGIPRDATVADVVRFESEELCNDYPEAKDDELMSDLGRYPHYQCTWVCLSPEGATYYLPEGAPMDIIGVEFGPDARIIIDLSEEGFLVLH